MSLPASSASTSPSSSTLQGKVKIIKKTQQKQQHHHHQRSALSTIHLPLLEWTTGSRRESTKKEAHKPEHGAAILRILSRTLGQDQAEIIIGKLQTCQKQTKGNGKTTFFSARLRRRNVSSTLSERKLHR
jgi:hypothetical protein